MNALTAASRLFRVAAPLLDVGEKAENQRGVDVLEVELAGPLAQTLAGEDEQQSEGVGIGFAGVGAVPSVNRHVLAQEAGDQRRNRRHGPSLATSASTVAAMSVISSGVASRY